MRAFRRREFLAGAALLTAAACAPGREEPTPTSGAAGTRAIPSEKASLDAAPSASASVAAEALTAARTVVAALACGDDETDLSDLLTGEASVEVPEQLTARAATNASLTARDGTIMHARVLDGYEQTVYADDNGVLLMIYTVSWQAPPERTAAPRVLERAEPGDTEVTSWMVTVTLADGRWQVADVSTGSRDGSD